MSYTAHRRRGLGQFDVAAAQASGTRCWDGSWIGPMYAQQACPPQPSGAPSVPSASSPTTDPSAMMAQPMPTQAAGPSYTLYIVGGAAVLAVAGGAWFMMKRRKAKSATPNRRRVRSNRRRIR